MAETDVGPRVAHESPLDDENSTIEMAVGGYCLWEFDAQAWRLKKATCADDYEPGSPPGEPGRFDGEIVRKHCELPRPALLEPAIAVS